MWGSERNDLRARIWTHLSCRYAKDYGVVTGDSLEFLECMVLWKGRLGSQS
jgi:hypothetical protein